VGLEWSNDPESYACDSVAIGRTAHVRQDIGDDPQTHTHTHTQKITRPLMLGVGRGADNHTP